MTKVVVYDIETLKSFFSYTDIDVKSKEVKQFIVHESKCEIPEMVAYIQTLSGMVGYNNLAFDYPVLHYIMMQYGKWSELSNKHIIHLIYAEAQRIIEAQNEIGGSKFVTIRSSEVIVPQLDLFKMWHYDNKAKLTSLKSLEISMNYPNVLDMPIDHSREDIGVGDIQLILDYNLNDVLATLAFYEKSGEKIALRKAIYKKYGLPCMNWNNGKIGEQLILKLYCDKTGKNPWEVKKLGSFRDKIELKDCIPADVNFTHEGFRNMLTYFKSKVIRETKGALDYQVPYLGVMYNYGLGGLHAAIKEGLYESDDTHVIKSLDVASLYPNIPIQYKFYPEHLGEVFLEVYEEEIVNVRLAEKAKPKAEQDMAIIDGYKEAANIPYGKSNERWSFLYDPLYTMKTTVTGQLLLTMLIEALSRIPDSQILMVNTDGLEIRLPRKYEDTYKKMCKVWEEKTGLVLEFVDYAKMAIADVNNYLAIDVNGKIKTKGRFEVDKKIGNDPAFYKDNSFRIIPLAIQEFFSKGTPVAETVMLHENIYDFCGRQKFKAGDKGVTRQIVNNAFVTSYEQKNVRYYISNKGAEFHKYYKGGKQELINKGYLVTVFNNYVKRRVMASYDINYTFYIKEANKEIKNIMKNQLKLDL